MWRPWSDSTNEGYSEYSSQSNNHSESDNYRVAETTQEPETLNNTYDHNSTSIIPQTPSSQGTSANSMRNRHYINYQKILSEKNSPAGKYFIFLYLQNICHT